MNDTTSSLLTVVELLISSHTTDVAHTTWVNNSNICYIQNKMKVVMMISKILFANLKSNTIYEALQYYTRSVLVAYLGK